MTLKQTRDRIAEHLTTELADITVHGYRPKTPKAFHGWVEFDSIGYLDDHELSYGEVGVEVQVLILVATDRTTFERMSDDITPDLIAACQAVGRGVIVRPYQESVGQNSLYSLSATFITESEAA